MCFDHSTGDDSPRVLVFLPAGRNRRTSKWSSCHFDNYGEHLRPHRHRCPGSSPPLLRSMDALVHAGPGDPGRCSRRKGIEKSLDPAGSLCDQWGTVSHARLRQHRHHDHHSERSDSQQYLYAHCGRRRRRWRGVEQRHFHQQREPHGQPDRNLANPLTKTDTGIPEGMGFRRPALGFRKPGSESRKPPLRRCLPRLSLDFRSLMHENIA